MNFNFWTAVLNFMTNFDNKYYGQDCSRDYWHRSNKIRAKGKMVKHMPVNKKRARRKMAKRSRQINRRRAA